MRFDLETFLPYRLHQAAERTSQQFQRRYQEVYGLNRSEWRVLFHVGSYGPISATDISQRSRLDKALISRALLKFEDRAWVERRHRDGDRRGHDLVLTKDGVAVFEDLRALAGAFNDKLVAVIGAPAAKKLLDHLQKLEADIDAEQEFSPRKTAAKARR